MNENRIYMDNTAATRTDPEVVAAMLPYFSEHYAVASSQFSHTPGIQAKEGLENARKMIAKKLNAKENEIVFTSGGTESNNLAIKGTAYAHKGKKNHIICSTIEQNAILHSCKWLEKEGFRVTTLNVDENGFVDVNHLKDSMTEDTFLVSVQLANQEVGTIQPVEEIGRLCRENGVIFHTDAQLGFTLLDVDVEKINADLLTVSAHKIHGPKGVGALYVKENTVIKKILHGGYHENDLRSGTENVPGIVGFGKAVEIAKADHANYVADLQKELMDGLSANINDVSINGPVDLSKRLPGNVNVSFSRVEGESVVLHLDMRGVAVITGSACFSRSLEPSYVMMAMGFSHERAHGSIRFTLSRFNQQSEIKQVVQHCREIVESLRKISPLT